MRAMSSVILVFFATGLAFVFQNCAGGSMTTAELGSMEVLSQSGGLHGEKVILKSERYGWYGPGGSEYPIKVGVVIAESGRVFTTKTFNRPVDPEESVFLLTLPDSALANLNKMMLKLDVGHVDKISSGSGVAISCDGGSRRDTAYLANNVAYEFAGFDDCSSVAEWKKGHRNTDGGYEMAWESYALQKALESIQGISALTNQ